MRVHRRLADAFVVLTFALALTIPLYVAFRDDRRVRSAYIGWRSGDYVYETSARFLGWRFSVRLDVPRRVGWSDPNYIPGGNDLLNGPGQYFPKRFGAGFDSYPLGSGGTELAEEPQWLGFGGGPAAPPGTSHRVYTIWFPVWFVVVALAMPGGRRIVRSIRARRRFGQGRCANCGYDLRGGNDRCPECGAETVTQPVIITRPGSSPDHPAAG